MQINMHEAKSQLSKLVQAALDGEEVIIARNGAPVVRITKYATVKNARTPGAWKGKMWLADDWDSPETNRFINEMMMNSKVFPDETEPHSVQEPVRAYKVMPKKPAVNRPSKRKP